MQHRIRTLVFATAGLLALAVGTPANAAFVLTVQETGGAVIPIGDDSPLDLNTVDPGVITVDTAALNLLLTNFQFTSLGAESNSTTGTPFSLETASISQTGEVQRAAGTAGTQSIEILVTDTDFTFPNANPKMLGSSASDTFRFTAGGDNRTFQSFFGPGNLENETTLASPLLAFAAPAGIGPFSTSGNAPNTNLGVQPIPFSLTNQTIITLGAGNGTRPRDQFTGATTVTAVPEPATLSLVLLGLPVLAIRRMRRRTA